MITNLPEPPIIKHLRASKKGGSSMLTRSEGLIPFLKEQYAHETSRDKTHPAFAHTYKLQHYDHTAMLQYYMDPWAKDPDTVYRIDGPLDATGGYSLSKIVKEYKPAHILSSDYVIYECDRSSIIDSMYHFRTYYLEKNPRQGFSMSAASVAQGLQIGEIFPDKIVVHPHVQRILISKMDFQYMQPDLDGLVFEGVKMEIDPTLPENQIRWHSPQNGGIQMDLVIGNM